MAYGSPPHFSGGVHVYADVLLPPCWWLLLRSPGTLSPMPLQHAPHRATLPSCPQRPSFAFHAAHPHMSSLTPGIASVPWPSHTLLTGLPVLAPGPPQCEELRSDTAQLEPDSSGSARSTGEFREASRQAMLLPICYILSESGAPDGLGLVGRCKNAMHSCVRVGL